ncbi:MAG: RNA 2',3'-cyclic phosphodiesterase [Candidatus Cloacimonetes bacterium]|nr:RNA 2',3'-cyclic phosphodiesterase [Candidatus Cloacimonadota bacterium]
MRLFVALDLPDEIREGIIGVINNLQATCYSDVKWVSPENLHITFQFIGDTKEEDVPEINKSLTANFSEVANLEFSEPKLEIIPGRDPKVIWISLENNEQNLAKASRRLKSKVREMGYKIDSRKLNFHITLGRIKKRLPENLINQILTTELKLNNFNVAKVTLYKSLLKPSGPRYIEIFDLKI